MVTLIDDVEAYCLAAGIEKITELQYRRSVRCFSDFLERPSTRNDLQPGPVNQWLAYIGRIRSARTALNRKRGITPVWNWLAQSQLVPFYNPRALRKIKVVNSPPVAWSVKQVRQLLEAAPHLPGTLQCGVPASHLMDAWIRVAYECALRPSDLVTIKWDQLVDNRLLFPQHKTGQSHVVVLSAATVESVLRLANSGSQSIFVLSKSGMRRWEIALFDKAKDFGFTRRRGQSSGTLRKTAATVTAKADGLQAASELLGHRSGTKVTRDHYVEPDALHANKPPQALIDALSRTDLGDARPRKAGG